MSIKKLIRSIDFIGPQPTMYINGAYLYQTLLGGILSFISILTLLTAFFYFLVTLFGRTSFTIMMNEEVNSNPVTNFSNTEIAVALIDSLANEIPNSDRIFSIIANFWWYQPIIDDKGEVLSYSLTSTPVELEKCKQGYHFASDTLWKDNAVFKSNASYCLGKKQSLIIQNTFGDNNYTGLVFWIYRCTNSSVKKDCLPAERIDSILENAWLTIRFSDYYFDNNKYGIPAIPFINTQMIQVSSTVYRRLWFLFQNVEYHNDEGFILPSTTQWEFSNFAMKEESVDLRKTTTVQGTFCVISVNNYHLIRKYYRKYYKAQNMMADFGGLVKGIILFVTILNYFPSERLYYSKLIKKNFFNLFGEKSFPTPKIGGLGTPNPNNISNFNYKASHNKFFSSQKINISSFVNISNQKIQHIQSQMDDHVIYSRNVILPQKVQKESGKISRNVVLSHHVQKESAERSLSCAQIFFPKFCFAKNSTGRAKLNAINLEKAFLIEQLDVRHVIDQITTTDKLTFLLTGYKFENVFRTFRNPLMISQKGNTEAMSKDFPDSLQLPDFIRSNWIEMAETYKYQD